MPLKSNMWKYFLKLNANEARCKICEKIIRTSGNTTNLKGHATTHKNLIEKNNNNKSFQEKKVRKMKNCM